MLKKTLLPILLTSFFLISCADSQKGKYDSRAVESLDSMSETIGDLTSASYTLNTVKISADGNESYAEHDVYMRGPDKLYVHSTGTKGKKSYWYDGNTLSYFSFDKNKYAIADAPETTMQTIEAINAKFGIDFPAADFFYPTLTDDILSEYNQVLFAGEEAVNGREATAIYASNDKETLQIWIDKATKLPLKFSIESKNKPDAYYEGTLSNFRIDPFLPDLLFEFKPPSGAEKTSLKPIK